MSVATQICISWLSSLITNTKRAIQFGIVFACGLAYLPNALLGQDESESMPQLWCEYAGYNPEDQPKVGLGKRIVFIAGDDEYRSEEALPMLGMIMAAHHGFDVTVLFPINPDTNLIQPSYQTNIPGMHRLQSADLVVVALRFRRLPDDQMKFFVEYLESGKPIIGLRTSTHAFNYPADSDSPYRHFSFDSRDWPGGFGKQVLGETWVNHHGAHGQESTRGVPAREMNAHPILKGVDDIWGDTDVYGIRELPVNAQVILLGQVIAGMKPTDPAVAGAKNDPMMPLAWTIPYRAESERVAKVFCTTMGAATDFQSEGLRRLIVNACYWSLDLHTQIPEKSNVDFVRPYQPTAFGFGTEQKHLKPADFNWRHSEAGHSR
ncbi:MAG TPA: ThuA domain-containing protein [Pirellulaceae bacterium]|nr:ThuA domain-containing protein [Pirellulaceae bacterium]HMO92053.1 ThuA domain-containing protein [Pirellulaceae bacterium]HMP68852.1 ThuA domain-containing protein [Pirellulaceae bacterium]